MKFHWGTAIFTFLGLFILTLAFVLYKSRQVDHSLVLDKYYEEDLAFQAKYEKMEHYKNLPEKVDFIKTSKGDSITIIFPTEEGKQHKGTITFYRPNASQKDQSFDIQTNQDGIMKIPLFDFTQGKWILKLDWTWGEVPLYTEELIII